jgi:cytochrome c biogenesis protein
MTTPITQPRLGVLGWLRWMWRQLTSMRTALFLLLILAVGAVPGSIFPQRSIDAARTADWIATHETVGPWLDRLGFFEVYASPWFAAVYLLLFVSLVGCVLPRSRLHWRAMRSRPPRAPRRLERLPAHAEATVTASAEQVLEAARRALRRRRYRVGGGVPDEGRRDGPGQDADGSVSAESGYLKDTGNLVFHLALVLIIIGVAVGHLFGWKGDVIVPVGQTFANSYSRYDTFSPGPWVDPESLSPFSVTVDRLDATFEDDPTRGRGQFGQPRDFVAHVTTADEPGDPSSRGTIRVNHPLEMDGASVFLLGNGYAPVVTVKDADGNVLYHGATPFLPQDNNYRSVGAVKVPAAEPDPLGFVGLFLPTAVITEDQGPTSVFPDARDPALALSAYEGNLFPGGRPQSVYTLDTSDMSKVLDPDGTDTFRIWLTPGKTVDLPDGRGSITFDRVERFAGLSIRHDPGKMLTLGSALAALAGLVLSLVVRRRRVFVRVVEGLEPGTVVVRVAGMAKDDDDGLGRIVDEVIRDVVDEAVPDGPATMRESVTR